MRPTNWLAACIFTAIAPVLTTAQETGIAIGWDSRSGATLLGELNCLACHEAAAGSLPVKQAPVLTEVGARITPQFLRGFLANPQALKPGSAMPDLLHGLPEKERGDAVEALTHYLASLGGPLPQKSGGSSTAQVSRGQDLFHSVGCVACHAPVAAPPKQKRDPAAIDDDEPKLEAFVKQSVPFGDLAMKTTLPALAKFLVSPLHARPAGRMPSLHLDASEANAIASYLLRDQLAVDEKATGPGLVADVYKGGFTKVPDFSKLKPSSTAEVKQIDLALALGVAPKMKISAGAFAVRFTGLIDVPQNGRYRFWTASDDGSTLRINNKLVVDNDGAHSIAEKEGLIDLRKGKHSIEVGFFESGGGAELTVFWQLPDGKEREPVPAGALYHDSASAMFPKGAIEFEPQPALVARGKELFASIGCASCHQTESPPKAIGPKLKAPALAALQPTAKGGCLDETVQAGRPRFALDADQRGTLRKTVADWKAGFPVADAKTAIDHRLNAFSCYACHGRDGKGGPDKQRSKYFTYEVLVDLGDEGRLPPALTGVGAKLTPLGFEDALFSGKRYRSSMATRMPAFGKDNIGHLPELFAKADEGRLPAHTPQFAKNQVDDGRKLVGRTTLACINCHAWGPHRLSGAEGLDLLEVPRRIRPEWFHAWLRDPNKLRPGTRMPTAWPDGMSFFRNIQGGDVDRQMDAIWAYLKAGDKGGFPAGLGTSDLAMLTPTEEPIVFRTFLDKVGAHAILVGFPQRMHIAFDANRVRTAVAWSGDFISTKAAWDGRAGNYAPIPSAAVVTFPDGPLLAKLGSITDAWPKDLPKKNIGSNRTPEGWQFLGYRYDEKRVPTFLYKFGDIEIEETPGVEIRQKGAYLLRQFRFRAPEAPADLYLRVATGKAIAEDDGGYRVDGKTEYRVIGATPQIRAQAMGQELLAPIRLQPDGKMFAATLTIEIAW